MTLSIDWTNFTKGTFSPVGDPVYTFQVNGNPTGQMTFDSGVGIKGIWDLAQFHVHAPSEHRYDGKQRDLEFHFVHSASDSDYAVLSVSFEVSEDAESSPILAPFIKSGKPNTSSNGKQSLSFTHGINISFFRSHFFWI